MGIIGWSSGEVKERLKEGNLKICVVGLGRIGLPTAALFAEAGAYVTGIDINPEVVKMVNAGRCHFVDETGLEEILQQVVSTDRLRVTLDFAEGIGKTDVIILCVPTPVDEAKTPDYSAVVKACKEIGRHLRKGSLVIVESTIGPGIIEGLVKSLLERESGLKAGSDFGLASCPERSDPGNIVKNMKTVPRVIGGINGSCLDVAAALYEAAFEVRVVRVSSPKVANAVKLTENLFRDVNIALANEFALLYEKLGIDTIEVINACATKYNFMPHFPGAGVGGPCLPSNPYYLIVEGVKVGNIPYLVRLAREINDRMPEHVVSLVSEAMNEAGKTVKGSKIAVLGITYKPGVKDLQLSPVGRIVARLEEMGAFMSLYDPMFRGEEAFNSKVVDCVEETVKGVDCIVIGTAHDEFRDLNWSEIRDFVHNQCALVDTRHVVKPSEARLLGFAYRGVGRPNP